LISDFSRRGLIDGRILRLPAIIVRPGVPTGAASSFCSGIIREPLKGEKSLLPVSRGLSLWVCSTRTLIKNLVFAGDIPAEDFGSESRVVNLPGITVTVEQILQALEAVGGKAARELVEEKHDPKVQMIVGNVPALFDTKKAERFGFSADGSLERTIREYIEDFGKS
jgi:nucleoside-diphosphate-sugar epimerase